MKIPLRITRVLKETRVRLNKELRTMVPEFDAVMLGKENGCQISEQQVNTIMNRTEVEKHLTEKVTAAVEQLRSEGYHDEQIEAGIESLQTK